MDELRSHWVFLSKKNFCLALVETINRCQFETGFLPMWRRVGGFLELYFIKKVPYFHSLILSLQIFWDYFCLVNRISLFHTKALVDVFSGCFYPF